MSRVAHPLPSFNTLDPFHRARSPRVLPVHRITPASGKSSLSFEASEAAPRETRSLDLDPRQRLPIGPHPSGSGSRSSTPTPAYPPPTAPSRSSLDSIKSRETRAQRRQGSIFNVPVSLNPALNASYSSLVAMHSQALGSDGEKNFSQPSAMSSVRETGSGKNNKRLRKANLPAPLDLDASTRPTRNPPPRPPTPGAARLSRRDPPLASLPSDPRPPRTRRRSRSASYFLNPNSDSPFPTPLTPSFRFLAPQLPEHREKKLNKLAKTLGENIPASLVFPSTSSTSTSATSKADLTAPTTPVSGHLIITDRVNEKSSRRVSKMLQALDLDSSLPSRQKNPKGISTWQPPAEWSMDPAEIKRDRDAPGFGYEGEEMCEDEVQGGWNADDYGAVLEHLRNLK